AIDAMVQRLNQTKDKPIDVTVLREGKQLTFHVQPKLADVQGQKQKRYRIGIQSVPMKVGNLPFAAAVHRSLTDNKKTSLLILELVKKLVTRKVSLRTVEGPIGIGRAAGQAASENGWTSMLSLP